MNLANVITSCTRNKPAVVLLVLRGRISQSCRVILLIKQQFNLKLVPKVPRRVSLCICR
jgi:hypothetical protein